MIENVGGVIMNDFDKTIIGSGGDWNIHHCKLGLRENCNLRRLFADLVTGDNCGDKKNEARFNPPIVACDLNEDDLILTFFPELKHSFSTFSFNYRGIFTRLYGCKFNIVWFV